MTVSRILHGHGRENIKPSDGEGLANWIYQQRNRKVEMAFDRRGKEVVTTF